MAWKARVGEKKAAEVTRKASVRGTSVHKITETYLMNEQIDFKDNPNNKVLFLKIKPILDRLDNIRLLETPIYSKKLGLAGTPDCISDYDGDLAVVDFKTSTRFKKREWIVNYFLQTACYGLMYEELFWTLPKKAVICMATEASEQPQLFVEPMETCVKMLYNFIKDPIAFQAKIDN